MSPFMRRLAYDKKGDLRRMPSAHANTCMTPDKTVVIRLSGGLGNQMFQYAMGVAVSQRIGFTLMLDSGFFETEHRSHRHYELNAFGVQEKTIDLVTHMRWEYGWFPTIHEPHFHHWEGVFTAPPYTRYRLSGYWQTDRYFRHMAQDIRAHFNTARFSCAKTKDMERKIQSAPCAVCVHVRRGDMMDPHVYERHGLVKRDYYDKARALLEKKDPQCHFFIFTDDERRVRDELSDWSRTSFVRGHDHYQDMMLMTLCRHYIIGNSTYGWWGAWLNPSSSKHVVAPKAWFAPSILETTSVCDVYGDSWDVI